MRKTAELFFTRILIGHSTLFLRRLYTHVDFDAKRHDSWRFQHPFFAPKKSISFFRPTPRGIRGKYTGVHLFPASSSTDKHVYTHGKNPSSNPASGSGKIPLRRNKRLTSC